MILENVEQWIRSYDNTPDGRKWNRAATRTYEALRRAPSLASREAITALRYGLDEFEMHRRMYLRGSGLGEREFEDRLRQVLEEMDIDGHAAALSEASLDTADIAGLRNRIMQMYWPLASGGDGGLDAQGGDFHVGATKILHFLFPDFLIMLDKRVAMAFREHHGVAFRRTTQPGWGVGRYIECLEHAQDEIRAYGPSKLRELAPGTPLPRIFDKVAWGIGG